MSRERSLRRCRLTPSLTSFISSPSLLLITCVLLLLLPFVNGLVCLMTEHPPSTLTTSRYSSPPVHGSPPRSLCHGKPLLMSLVELQNGPGRWRCGKRQTESPSSTVSFMRTVNFTFFLVTCSASIISLKP